jgi:hypothetical protein
MKGILSNCVHCNKEIYIKNCLIGKKKFCSRYCTGKGTKKRSGKVVVNCKRCNKEFKISKYRVVKSKTNKFYCSLNCKNMGIYVECANCLKKIRFAESTLNVRKSGLKCCSRKCMDEAREKGIVKIGFKKIYNCKKTNPYKRIWNNGKCFKEHRLIMENFLGRKLLKSEHVHHINENQKDNRIENLQIVDPIEHGRIHKSKK